MLALEAPAGEFELRLSLSPTLAQSLANALSAIGLGSAILTLLLWSRLTTERARPLSSTESQGRWLMIVAAIGIAMFLLKALALDAANTTIKRSQFGDLREADARANIGNRIDLLAVEAPAERFTVPRDIQTTGVCMGAPLERDYSSIIRMRDPQGFVIAQRAPSPRAVWRRATGCRRL